MKRGLYFSFILLSSLLAAQFNNVRKEILYKIKNAEAKVAVSVTDFSTGKSFNINGDMQMPMLSVFKFHIALAVLHQVDLGKLSLDQKIPISKSELLENTWSPIRAKYPEGNIELSLRDLLDYTVAQSDNNGCDILLEILGGTENVQTYINNLGISDFTIKANEAKMHEAYEYMYWNTTTTNAANKILKRFIKGKILKEETTEVLKNIMLGTTTGATKLAAGLPKGTALAHKTGSSGKDQNGLTVAENDIGIVFLPNGKQYAISVFVSDSKESEEFNTKLISTISRLVYTNFTRGNTR